MLTQYASYARPNASYAYPSSPYIHYIILKRHALCYIIPGCVYLSCDVYLSSDGCFADQAIQDIKSINSYAQPVMSSYIRSIQADIVHADAVRKSFPEDLATQGASISRKKAATCPWENRNISNCLVKSPECRQHAFDRHDDKNRYQEYQVPGPGFPEKKKESQPEAHRRH